MYAFGILQTLPEANADGPYDSYHIVWKGVLARDNVHIFHSLPLENSNQITIRICRPIQITWFFREAGFMNDGGCKV
jgi:hypothetical protein